MTTTGKLPLHGSAGSDGPAVKPDLDLINSGWTQRNLWDPARVDEVLELYTSLGFEVKIQHLKPSDFGGDCTSCAESACSSYILIYTRRPDETGKT